jgi:hypothetical protein
MTYSARGWQKITYLVTYTRFVHNVLLKAYFENSLKIYIPPTSSEWYRVKFITYLLTPWSRVLLEKLTGFAANQEIPRILWNPKVH